MKDLDHVKRRLQCRHFGTCLTEKRGVKFVLRHATGLRLDVSIYSGVPALLIRASEL